MPAKLTRRYRAVRAFLHPVRVGYVRVKAALLPILLPWWGRLGRPVLLHVPAGTVRLAPRGDAAITLLANGSYEPEVMAFLTAAAGEGAFLDVGANAGIFSLAIARAHPRTPIYAFEPATATFALLQENIALNGFTNVHAVRAAVAEAEGQATLTLNRPDRSGLNTLLPPSQLPPSRAPRGKTGAETVPTVCLDEFLARTGVGPVGVLKIDVEGAEAQVIRGAAALLSQRPAPVVVFESWPDHDQAAARLLLGHGYAVRDLTEEIKIATRPDA